MTENEAESRIVDLVSRYCFINGVSYKELCTFLFTEGYIYRINDILRQVDTKTVVQ